MSMPTPGEHRKFLLILALLVLLCIGTGLAVITLLPRGETNVELLEQVERAGSAQQKMLGQLEAMQARVRELQELNDRLVAEAAAAKRPPPAPVPDPLSPEPPAPDEPPRRRPEGAAAADSEADAVLRRLSDLLGPGLTNATPTVVTGASSRVLANFIRQAGAVQSRREAGDRALELASRLGLSADQQAQVEQALLRQKTAQADFLSNLLGPPPLVDQSTQQAFEALQEGENAAMFSDILSAEQMQEYEKWQEAERRSAAEAGALQSLAGFTQALPDLSQEQKDRLYQHFLANPNRLEGLPPGVSIPGLEQRDDGALKDILTPAQHKAWNKQQASGPRGRFPGAPGVRVHTFNLQTVPDRRADSSGP